MVVWNSFYWYYSFDFEIDSRLIMGVCNYGL